MVSARFPNGSVLACTHTRRWSACPAGQSGGGGTGSLRRLRVLSSFSPPPPPPPPQPPPPPTPMASQATTGRRSDASSATESSVASASACRLDHTCAQPLSSGFLEQGGHVLVGLQRGCGEVPGVAVGLIAECVRDLPVGGGALGERNSVIDRRADEGMGELWSRAVHPDQACLLGRGERFGGQPGYGRRRQVWAVGDRGKQQRLMR